VRRAPALVPGALRRALFLGQELIEISDIEIVDAAKNVGASGWPPGRIGRSRKFLEGGKGFAAISTREPLHRFGKPDELMRADRQDRT
jgi:hypothetical protein